MLGRAMTTPHVAELERYLLQRLLKGEESPHDFTPEHFHVDTHKALFVVLQEADLKGDLDLTKLPKELKKSIERAAGPGFISRVMSIAAPSDPHWRHTLDNYKLARQLVAAAEDIVRNGERDATIATEFIRKSITTFEGLLASANLPPPTLTDRMVVRFEKMTRDAERRVMSGLSYGYSMLDHMTAGMHPGSLIIVGARPGMGKTPFVLSLAASVAKQGKSVCLFSLEEDGDKVTQRFLRTFSKIPHLRHAKLGREDWRTLTETAGVLSDFPIFVDDDAQRTVCQMRDVLKTIPDLALVVVNSLNQVEPEWRGETREREVAEISRGLRLLAREFRVPVVATADCNRGPELRQGWSRRPRVSDLRDSGALEADAALVLLLYRDEIYHPDSPDPNIVEVNLARHQGGPTGSFRLVINAEFGIFAESV